MGLASFVLFVGSEAVLWRVPVWYAEGVTQLGHVALYVVIPEVLLGIGAYLVFLATEERPVWARLAGAFVLMVFYQGGLTFFYFLFERVF